MLEKQDKKAPSISLQEVRERFRLARKFINPIYPLIRIGLKDVKKKKTPLSRAMSIVLQSAIDGVYPAIYVNPAKVKISHGSLPGLLTVGVDRIDNQIIVYWNTEPYGRSIACFDDEITLCAYDVEGAVAAVNEQLVIRDEGSMQLLLPEGMETTAVHLYLMVRERSGKLVSISQYLGVY